MTRRSRFLSVLATLLALGLSAPAVMAQDQVPVQFTKGSDRATINGTIVGDEYIDYLLGAKKGQTMAVSLTPGQSNGIGNVYFNIMPPKSTGEAIYNGSIDGLNAKGVKLPKSGNYVIRVYQLGDDADTGKTSAFKMTVRIK